LDKVTEVRLSEHAVAQGRIAIAARQNANAHVGPGRLVEGIRRVVITGSSAYTELAQSIGLSLYGLEPAAQTMVRIDFPLNKKSLSGGAFFILLTPAPELTDHNL
jgi:hypothetical protein